MKCLMKMKFSFMGPTPASSIHPSFHPSIYAFIHPSFHPSIHSSIHPFFCLSIHSFIHGVTQLLAYTMVLCAGNTVGYQLIPQPSGTNELPVSASPQAWPVSDSKPVFPRTLTGKATAWNEETQKNLASVEKKMVVGTSVVNCAPIKGTPPLGHLCSSKQLCLGFPKCI